MTDLTVIAKDWPHTKTLPGNGVSTAHDGRGCDAETPIPAQPCQIYIGLDFYELARKRSLHNVVHTDVLCFSKERA